MTAAGTIRDLAPFDDTIAQLCRAGAGRDRLMEAVDRKMLCAPLCCCSVNPIASSTGRESFRGCVSATLGRRRARWAATAGSSRR